MKRIILSLLLFCLPIAVLADGMVIPTIAFPAQVTIPDQRALICFSNGTERLVIETRFTGEGTNFAWVMPLPSQPVIEEATTGLFPTLQYLFRPEIVHDVPRYYIGILLVLGIVYMLWRSSQSVWNGFVAAFLILLVLVLAAMLLPALSVATKAGMSSATLAETVSVLDRKLVGIFETTTISSHDPKALVNWLHEGGFSLSTNAGPVVASYVKDGWVFVATKIRRDDAKLDTSTPHPLSFTFKTDKPVYPMRLTGVDNDRLNVELYVFGPARADALHFKAERCTRPNYPEPPPNDYWSWNWLRWSPETPNIVHPLLRKWVIGSPVATKLIATLSHSEMRQDVWLDWISFSEKKNHLFSQAGALTIALNWAAGVFAAGLMCIGIVRFARKKSNYLRGFRNVTVGSVSLAGLVYLCLPKIEVRLEKVSPGIQEASLFQFYEYLMDTNPVTRAEISVQAKHLLNNPTNDVEWGHFAGRLQNLDNYLLGGRIREEDSPGNFSLRESGDQLEFITYDAQGAEHIEKWTWDLRPQH